MERLQFRRVNFLRPNETNRTKEISFNEKIFIVRYIRGWPWGIFISWCCGTAVHFSCDGPRAVFEGQQTRIMHQARDPRRPCTKNQYQQPWTKYPGSGGHHKFIGVATLQRLLNQLDRFTIKAINLPLVGGHSLALIQKTLH